MKKLIEWIKSKIPLEAIKNHPLVTKLVDSYQALPPQRKKIVNIGGALGGVFILYLTFSAGFGWLSAIKLETEMKAGSLLKLALEYDTLLEKNQPQLKNIEQKLKSSKDWVPSQYLKSIFLTRANVPEPAIKIEDKPGKTFGDTQQIESQVEVKGLALKQVVDVLNALSAPTQALSIQNFSLEPVPANPNQLNLTMNVQSFRQK